MEKLKELEKKIKEKEEENKKLKNNEVVYNLSDYENQLKKKKKEMNIIIRIILIQILVNI
jgi:hypothetical protein